MGKSLIRTAVKGSAERISHAVQPPPVCRNFRRSHYASWRFHPPGGSDTLGTQNFATNPLFSISVAVNRKTKYGQPANPEEAISRMDAIRMFTTWAAYGGFQEKTRGSIETGKLADLVVLSGDPLTVPAEHILDLNVDYTILDGKIAYKR